MNWRVKGVIQKLLSALPAGEVANDCLQRTLGGLRDFERNVDTKVVSDWLVFASHMKELGVTPKDRDYLEIGTGWYPALPICYSLAGARSCRSFDLNCHLSSKLTLRMLSRLECHLPAIAQAVCRPLAEVRQDYARLRNAPALPNVLEQARIDYVAPADAARTGLPPESVDVVFSNSVFEHVPPESILRIMKESRRVLRPGGIAIHSVNCGDHYAYFDRNITPINYLTYSNQSWRFWNNRLLYQNRLRPSDFLELAQSAGFEIVLCKYQPRATLLAILPQMKIAPEFSQYPPEQLCSTSIDFVCSA